MPCTMHTPCTMHSAHTLHTPQVFRALEADLQLGPSALSSLALLQSLSMAVAAPVLTLTLTLTRLGGCSSLRPG